MDLLNRVSLRIEGIVRILVIAVMIIMLGAVILDVLARNTPLRVRGLDEVARYSLVWLVFLVTGAGARYGDLIGMDALAKSLPRRAKIFVWFLQRLLFLLFLSLFAWFSLGLVQLMLSTGRSSANLHIPLWFVYAPIFLGTLLMFFSLLVDFVVRLSRNFELGEDVTSPADELGGSFLWK